jgi:hypothetical protein
VSTVTPGKPFAGIERAAASVPGPGLNLDIRRNIFDKSGKEVATGASVKQANGEEATANGTIKTDAAGSSATTAAGAAAAAAGGGVASARALDEFAQAPAKVWHCYICGNNCTRVRYHSAKGVPLAAAPGQPASVRPRFDICASCFLEGRFPASSSATDFVKIEQSAASLLPGRDAPWTEGEALLLLEALELFDDNWDSVAAHVGTRTKEECVLKFMQMDIDEKYLDGEPLLAGRSVNGGVGGGAAAGGGLIASIAGPGRGRAPFSRAENPVLSVVSFLASLSNPRATAAAAGKTTEELRRSLRRQLEKQFGGGGAVGGARTGAGAGASAGGRAEAKESANDASKDSDDAGRGANAAAAAAAAASTDAMDVDPAHPGIGSAQLAHNPALQQHPPPTSLSSTPPLSSRAHSTGPSGNNETSHSPAAAAATKSDEPSSTNTANSNSGTGIADVDAGEDDNADDAAGPSAATADTSDAAVALTLTKDGSFTPSSSSSSSEVGGGDIASAATAALALSAARAGGLLSHEERHALRLVHHLVATSLAKLEMKQRHFADMEAVLNAERRELEHARQQMYLDRLAFKNRMAEVQAAMQAASLGAGGGGAEGGAGIAAAAAAAAAAGGAGAGSGGGSGGGAGSSTADQNGNGGNGVGAVTGGGDTAGGVGVGGGGGSAGDVPMTNAHTPALSQYFSTERLSFRPLVDGSGEVAGEGVSGGGVAAGAESGSGGGGGGVG